jgi:hypothetical protein
LVEREQRGRFAYYSLAGPEVEAILVVAEGLLRNVADLVGVCENYQEEAGF